MKLYGHYFQLPREKTDDRPTQSWSTKGLKQVDMEKGNFLFPMDPCSLSGHTFPA